MKSQGSAAVVVAGATGNLGMRIVRALRSRNATVRALVRPSSNASRIEALRAAGADVLPVDYHDAAALRNGCTGAGCVVSALSGLQEVIVDAQGALLAGAVAAGVRRFIPSDYCI
ncbi:MAG: NmrA family NAD(P)-binding protein, partial [Gemmatimonadaceae bacterium]